MQGFLTKVSECIRIFFAQRFKILFVPSHKRYTGIPIHDFLLLSFLNTILIKNKRQVPFAMPLTSLHSHPRYNKGIFNTRSAVADKHFKSICTHSLIEFVSTIFPSFIYPHTDQFKWSAFSNAGKGKSDFSFVKLWLSSFFSVLKSSTCSVNHKVSKLSFAKIWRKISITNQISQSTVYCHFARRVPLQSFCFFRTLCKRYFSKQSRSGRQTR